MQEVKPTPEMVQSACLDHVPGARLTKDLSSVIDSKGYLTTFFLVDGRLLYARTITPDGFCSWMRNTEWV